MPDYSAPPELDMVIGQGHYGTVYRATDNVHGTIAVKAFEQETGESQQEWSTRKDQLLREGQSLSQAEHDNVVKVYYLTEDSEQDRVLLAMEYCPDGSIEESYQRGPLRIDSLRTICTDIALGLQALHLRNMLHRDIKPGNILIGEDDCYKLGDFGLVTDNLVNGYASQKGYADHLAPEIWCGKGTSRETDIWALGMTAYRLLHGHQWYEENCPSPAQAVQEGGFRTRLKWLPHVPDRWRRFVRKCMHDNPDQRYGSAIALQNAIASLPAKPAWKCSVGEAEIRWEREQKGRKIQVRWNRLSTRRHTWQALSLPGTSGVQRRTLAGSDGIIGLQQVRDELRAFFESQLS